MTTKQTVKGNFKFTAYDSRNREIELRVPSVVSGITEEEAKMVRMGIEIGLHQKYDCPIVCFNRI